MLHFHTELAIQRFHRSYKVDPNTNCWNWTGKLNQDGYGRMTLLQGKIKGSHRVSVWLDGRDPTGHCVCHTCDNPACVNPEHLVVADAAWNNDDKKSKGRDHQPKGTKNPQAKLTEDIVREIKSRVITTHRPGKNPKSNINQLAKEYNVHPESIRFIANGKTWKHVN